MRLSLQSSRTTHWGGPVLYYAPLTPSVVFFSRENIPWTFLEKYTASWDRYGYLVENPCSMNRTEKEQEGKHTQKRHNKHRGPEPMIISYV